MACCSQLIVKPPILKNSTPTGQSHNSPSSLLQSIVSTRWAYSPLRAVIMLLRSRTSCPVGVSSLLSRFFAHAVVSCPCLVGSAHTCRLFPSLSQLILLASDQRLLSEWIRLLINHFPLLSGNLSSLTNSSFCVKTNFPTRGQFLPFSSLFVFTHQ